MHPSAYLRIKMHLARERLMVLGRVSQGQLTRGRLGLTPLGREEIGKLTQYTAPVRPVRQPGTYRPLG